MEHVNFVSLNIFQDVECWYFSAIFLALLFSFGSQVEISTVLLIGTLLIMMENVMVYLALK